MSKHLQRKYAAAFRRRKREERQRANEPAVVPASDAERVRQRRPRKRLADGGDAHGSEVPDGGGPSRIAEGEEHGNGFPDGGGPSRIAEGVERGDAVPDDEGVRKLGQKKGNEIPDAGGPSRIAEGEERGIEFPDGEGLRRLGREGGNLEEQNAVGTTAGRLGRRKRRMSDREIEQSDREEGESTDDSTVGGRVRRRRRRQRVRRRESVHDAGSVRDLVTENPPELGVSPPMGASEQSLHVSVVQSDEEEVPSNSALIPRRSGGISDDASQEPDPRGPNYDRATLEFRKRFLENPWGAVCSICDRLWFLWDLKPVTEAEQTVLVQPGHYESAEGFMGCHTCRASCKQGKIPTMSKTNGYRYPPKPGDLPTLDMIAKRLISPIFVFMTIRRLCHTMGQYGIVGNNIYIPVKVQEMVKVLPRALDDDHAINVCFKKHIAHRTSAYSGYVNKRTVYEWLKFLVDTPLYRREGITFDEERLNAYGANPQESSSRVGGAVPQEGSSRSGAEGSSRVGGADPQEGSSRVGEADPQEGSSRVGGAGSTRAGGADPQEGSSRSGEAGVSDADRAMILDIIDFDDENLAGIQETALYDENSCLVLCPTMNRRPVSIQYTENGEELANPDIYLGQPRKFLPGANPTVFNKASSEARRADRRGAKPEHILEMALNVLYCRIKDGLKFHYKTKGTANVTRAQITDPEFQKTMMELSLQILKGVPNGMQYMQEKKQDLFAMIRQLGKPTMFLTMSASEIQWPDLLKVLHKLSDDYSDEDELTDPLRQLSPFKRKKLVNEDPVSCAAHFDKLVNVIMHILQSPRYSPFGKYRVKDYFKRIEFQQRGSAHAHIMLWCENDPREEVSEDMPATIEMINTICSIDAHRWLDPLVAKKHEHAHTRTCYKHNDKRCRFNIPFFPMDKDRMLMPLPADDSRRSQLKKKALEIREIMETKQFENFDEFLADCECTKEYYLDVIRAWLQRPTFFFKRSMNQLYLNPFNIWIGGVLRSNSDLQFIMDAYSCASYLANYINKVHRGISQFYSDLIQLQEHHPECDYHGLMKKIAMQVLTKVEMSSQEAAWILLRKSMTEASRKVEFIPTMWPDDRTRCRKRHEQMEAEGLDDDSVDVWTRNIIQKYEDREELDEVCLADFVAWYTPIKRTKNSYKLRKAAKILRWRGYNMSELGRDPTINSHKMVDYKRESVLLFLPFRNERVDILDQNKFLQLYESHQDELMAKRQEYDCELNLEQALEEYNRINAEEDSGDQERAATERHSEFVRGVDIQPNYDDIEDMPTSALRAIIKPRSNVMPKADYCAWMRQANVKQRMLVLHIIHHETSYDPEIEPIRIFLTGPAGSGKTFTLRLVMETYNRYSQVHNSRNNAYLVSASTGKAAVNLDGVTVHRAYRIAISRQRNSRLSDEWLQMYQHEFQNIRVHIIDEVSMLSAGNFRLIHTRLQDIHCDTEHPFARNNMIFTGDHHQLSPVNALPVYKAPRDSLGGNCLWESVKLYELDQVMRQADVEFSAMLTAIGDGNKLTADQKKLIESRFKSVEECHREASDAVWLFHQNADVDQFNREALSELEGLDCLAEDIITGYSNSAQLTGARTKLHKMSTAQTSGMPFMVRFCIGKPYMITVNIDGDDNLVNGAIGELKYVEMRENDAGEQQIHRLWLKFDVAKIGTLARSKAQGVIDARPEILQKDWTPITKQHVNISLGGTIKCKRIQFPITSACSMTIHKSQGGTFPKIVYQYSRNQEQKLVYVALSRVTSLDGLYMTYADNPSMDPSKERPVFHHARGSNSPAMRELRDEYKRLRNNRFRTIGDDLVEKLEKSGPASTLMTINVQSLNAHHADISIDPILTSVDYLALSETRLDDNSSVGIEGYTCVIQSKRNDARSGGVAIYQKSTSSTSMAVPYLLETEGVNFDESLGAADKYGDICAAEVEVMGTAVILVSVYISPGTTTKQKKAFVVRKLLPSARKNLPMVVTGDFNIDVSKRENADFLDLMGKLHLSLANNVRQATTHGGTVLDLTFTRGIHASVTRYVSYFSYHRPMLSILRTEEPEPSHSQ